MRLQSAVQERNALEESAKHMAASERAAREELDGMRGGHEPLKAEAGSLKARLQALRAQHDAEEREAYETVRAGPRGGIEQYVWAGLGCGLHSNSCAARGLCALMRLMRKLQRLYPDNSKQASPA